MRVVVTGAAGFVGSALVPNLERRGVEVVALSRRSAASGIQIVDYAQCPVGDVLVHLAEESDRTNAASVGHLYEQQAHDLLQNLLAKQWQRVVYTSSAALYGDRHNTARRPDDPLEPVDTYTRLKYRCEQAVIASRIGCVARLTNLYGPGMAASNVISNLLAQLPVATQLRVRDATPVRDFLWIEDAAEALARMAVGSACGVFNVGSGVGTSIGELAALVLHITGCADYAVVSTQPSGQPSRIVVDISATSDVWDWRPEVDLSSGIRTLVEHQMGIA